MSTTNNPFDDLLEDIAAGRVEYNAPDNLPYDYRTPTIGDVRGAHDLSQGTMHGPRFPVGAGDVVQPEDYRARPYFAGYARVVGEPNG
ncbi:hypothetical protein ACLTEW_18430 [Gordonia lacunae]|uniref:hypothetical protein n=1 Tax=Gordonia lacunae TaxID=417102 RepID=UPI0039E60394